MDYFKGVDVFQGCRPFQGCRSFQRCRSFQVIRRSFQKLNPFEGSITSRVSILFKGVDPYEGLSTVPILLSRVSILKGFDPFKGVDPFKVLILRRCRTFQGCRPFGLSVKKRNRNRARMLSSHLKCSRGAMWVQSTDGEWPCPDLSRSERREILKRPAIFDPRR